MAKRLNVDLAFNADTSQAKKNIQELQTSLNNISNIQPKFGMALTKEMQTAVTSAKELQTHISNAVNVNTGNLDLSKLNASLKASGTNLATLSGNLLNAGLAGEQAFMNIQRSVASASVQIRQANGLLANFWTTLKNTARWQLSSSMLHGFMGAMQSAYGYAQDLDKSLNNIRIVTGYNVDTMTQFAEQANKAAKALSTTTTSYTDAALIFYQQGLEGEAVTQRTDTVVKMANVTGESAAAVSDYMTAVWNNFDDGSKSLEYYADVMTALGAATASSTDEIAAGLEKFASIAETVGLSYEYATAALATVTAETRQSADVVGTAFKTIFARIQGLELGETLEDGVNLNKYSSALKQIGIDVLDANNNIRQMDDILNDLGEKWETLTEAQKAATAQTVAGVRQYSQLMALMNNWDTFKVNVDIAADSEGTLQEQADIYEESWAAASKRVKASLQGLYNDLIPTDFIISMTDGLADILSAIDTVVEGFGGLPSILLLISTIALSKMGPSLANGINLGVDKLKEFGTTAINYFQNIPANLKNFVTHFGQGFPTSQLLTDIGVINNQLKTAEEHSAHFATNFSKVASESLKTGQSMNVEALRQASQESLILSNSFSSYLTDTGKVYNLQGLIEQNASKLTQAEKDKLVVMQQQTLELAAQKAEAQAVLDTATRSLERMQLYTRESVYTNSGYRDNELDPNQFVKGVKTIPTETNDKPQNVDNVASSMQTSYSVKNEEAQKLLTSWNQVIQAITNVDVQVNNINGKLALTSTSTSGIGTAASGAAEAYGNVLTLNDQILNVLNQQGVTEDEKQASINKILDAAETNNTVSKEALQNYRDGAAALTKQGEGAKQLTTAMVKTKGQAKQVAMAYGNSETYLVAVENKVYEVLDAEAALEEKQRQFNAEWERTINYLQSAGSRVNTFGAMLTAGLQGFSTVAMGINSVSNAIRTLNDDSAGLGQKLTAVSMGLVTGFNAAKTVISGVSNIISIMSNGAKAAAVSEQMLVIAKQATTAATLKEMAAAAASTGATLQGTLAKELLAAAEGKGTAATAGNIAATLASMGVANADTVAETLLTIAKEQGALAAYKAAAAHIAQASAAAASLGPLLAIVAVIGALVLIINAVVKAYNKESEAAKKATQAAKDLGEQAEKTAEKAESIKAAFDEYETVKATLDDCVRGTTEWYDALNNVNEKAIELLKTYPELSKFLTGRENGILTFDTAGIENYITELEGIANATNSASIMASANAAEAQAHSSAVNLSRTIFGGKNDTFIKNIDILGDVNLTSEEFKAKLISLGLATESTVDKYLKYQDSIQTVATETMNAATQIKNAGMIITNSQLGPEGSDVEVDIGGKAYTAEYDKTYDTLMASLSNMIRTYGKNSYAGYLDGQYLNIDQLWDLYQQETGVAELKSNAIRNIDGVNKFTYKNEKGELEYVTAEVVAATVANARALEKMGVAAEGAATVLSGLSDDGLDLANAMAAGASDDGTVDLNDYAANFTQGQLNNISQFLDENGNIKTDENGNIDAGFYKALNINEGDFASLAELYQIDIKDLAKEMASSAVEVSSSLTDDQVATLTRLDTSNMTIAQQQQYANNKIEAGENLTSTGLNNFTEIIQSQNKGNIEGLTAFYEGLAAINLSSEDAAQQIQDLADKYNITGPSVEYLIGEVEELEKTFNISTDNITQNAKNIKDVVGDGLEVGDIISEKDIQKLQAAGVDTSNYFTKMADGSYILTSAADNFNKVVNEITFDGLKDQLKDFDKAADQAIAGTNNKFLNDDDAKKYLLDTNISTGATFKDEFGYVRPSAAEDLGRTRLGYINNFEAGTFNFDEKQLELLEAYQTNPELTLTSDQLTMIAEMIGIVNEKQGEMQGQALLSATSLHELSQQTTELGQEATAAYGDALVVLASKMGDCGDAIQDYNDIVAKYGKDSTQAKKAQIELSKAIQKSQWKKFTKQAKEAAKSLKGLKEGSAEAEEQLSTIQGAFKDAFGMDVSMKQLRKFQKQFEQWGNATEEEADDIATQIYSLLNFDEYMNDGELVKEIELMIDDSGAYAAFSNIEGGFSKVKSIIESNPPTVSATGEADFSAMITQMLAAGATAADVAAALKMIGQTEVDFSSWGTGLPMVNLNDPLSVANFVTALENWRGDISGDGDISVEEIQSAFPGGKIPPVTGTGGGTGSGDSNSGGGGGGSRDFTEKNYRYEGDRFHTLTNQLEDLEAEYDAISEAKDRAFGADKLKLLDDQIEKTQDLIDQNDAYLASLQEQHRIDRGVLEAQYANLLGDNALELKIGTNGEIENYEDIEKSLMDDYNAKGTAFKNGDMSEEEWKAYELLYDKVLQDLELYEASEDELRDALARKKTLEYQKIDEQLEKVEYAIQVRLDVKQDDLDLIEHQLELLDDKAFSSAERISRNVEKASNLVEQIDTTQKAMKDILSVSGISDSDINALLDPNITEQQMATILNNKNITEAQVDSIRSYRDSLLDMNTELLDIRNTVREEVTTAFEEYNEELDRGISKFDHYNSVLESYQNIIDIVGKDALGVSDEMMAEMGAAKVENSINQLNAVREKYESITKARDEALAKSEDMSLTEEDRQYWAEQYEMMNESAQEAQEELMSTWESTLEGIVAQFEASVQAAVDAFNKAIYDGGLEGLSADYEWNQEMDDMYLDDYKQIYELSKLTRDINKSMDDTKSIAGKQKLKGLIEDINKLQEEGVEMSEYDLEYLQAEYDLRLAEIALEDAQRAKDTVRLSRDSEGNFSYVYTQNTDAVDEAQQKYEDALYSMQDLSSNYIDEMSAQLIETSQAMQEELAALRVEDYASIDEYYAAVAEVEAKYQDKLSRQEAELQKAIGNNKELYDQDWANYAAATGYKISATEDFVTAWGDTTLAGMMGLDDTTSFTSVIGSAAESLVSGLLDAANTYYNNVDAANEAAGTSTGQFAEVLQENIDAINTESAEAAKAVEEMASKMDTAMQDIMDKTAEWQREHSKNIEKIIADNIKAAQSYNGLLEYLSNNAVGDYEVLIRGSSNGSGEGQSADGAESATGMATGGYTGDWGTSDGKLAWLHEKELVLNQSDTANMLKAIEMTRYLMSVIDAQANQLSQGLGSLQAATIHEDRQETLEQHVEIKADFPNVSNHTEIEEALGNLINTASQYANRRK